MSALFDDLEWRGLVYQHTDPAIEDLLNNGQVTAYIGFDPTAASLHVGNLLQLLTLRRLQESGHTPIVLAGGATAMIGDPSFKSAERQLLSDETIERNLQGVRGQLQQFLDFSDASNGARLVNNYDWFKNIGSLQFLRDVGKHFTVNQLLARESVRARLEDREQGISYTEFSYSLVQAYDFLHLFREFGCTLQMGASDQWGNIVSGVDLIRRCDAASAYGLSTPLVVKSDGTKFGKTETGTVWLDADITSPYAFYQFFLRSEDSMVVQYLKFFTFLSRDEITDLEVRTAERPQARAAQKALAKEVTRIVHGDVQAERAIKASEALFGEDIADLDEDLLLQVFAEAPSAGFAKSSVGQLTLADALVKTGLSPSKSAARTAIDQGGVSINNRKRSGAESTIDAVDLLHGSYVVLRRGKKEYALVQFR